MLYVVTESLKTDGGTEDVDTHLTLTFERPGGCPVEEVQPVHVTGKLTNHDGLIHFEGTFSVAYTDVCCRCLQTIQRQMKADLEADFVRGKEKAAADEEIYVYEGSKLTLGEAVEDAFILNLPYRDYCDSGCGASFVSE